MLASHATSPPGAAWTVALKNLWHWVRRAVKARKVRRLRVCETLSLGERRFLAVIEFDRQEFLVGVAEILSSSWHGCTRGW